MVHTLKVQRDLAVQSAKDAKRISTRLNREREVDEDMYMIMCENVREKDLEVPRSFLLSNILQISRLRASQRRLEQTVTDLQQQLEKKSNEHAKALLTLKGLQELFEKVVCAVVLAHICCALLRPDSC